MANLDLVSKEVNVKYNQKMLPSASSNSCLEEVMGAGTACGQQSSLPSLLCMDKTVPGDTLMSSDRCLDLILRSLSLWHMSGVSTCWDGKLPAMAEMPNPLGPAN